VHRSGGQHVGTERRDRHRLSENGNRAKRRGGVVGRSGGGSLPRLQSRSAWRAPGTTPTCSAPACGGRARAHPRHSQADPVRRAAARARRSFHRARAPHGRTDPFSDASGNRGLAAAGRYAAFIWGGGGKNGFVRISVRRFSSKSWAQRHTPRRSQGSAFDVGRRRIAVTVGCCVAVLRSAGSMDDRAACGSRRARQLAPLR
jgi:hypothetical protein